MGSTPSPTGTRTRGACRARGLVAAVLILCLWCVSCGGADHPDPFALCPNGHLDPGEECDDGNTVESDDCLSTCVAATCADGFGTCSGSDFRGKTCETFGRSGGTLLCKSNCRLDTSQCGPTFTPVPAATPTPTPPCGNGFLDTGETCANCPIDCTIRPCAETTPLQRFEIDFTPPAGQSVSSVTVLLGYRSDIVSLPGSGSDSSVTARVKNRPVNTFPTIQDLDYGLQVSITRSGGQIATGRLFTVDFDSCEGSAPATAADFGCTASCVGCSCMVAGP